MSIQSPPKPPVRSTNDKVIAAVRQYWGYDQLRSLQPEAIQAALEQRDSLVVMPTGGGKSLCYQVPPVVAGRLDVVVSPLISLMKDQVDALRAAGYPAAALYSGMAEDERAHVFARLNAGELRLLFVAPERLLTQSFLGLLQRQSHLGAFAIDEAHCISQWGHDFRPEYRKLAVLRKLFPRASFHAYTATATPVVQQDIIKGLGLKNPRVLIGRFDRPNLTYRVEQRRDLQGQLLDVIRRHQGEAVIVYCISRKDAEQIAANLVAAGVKAAPYHAGLSPQERTRTQEAFSAEKLDVVVATVAFGMGIDRSNVRCVVHVAMPKSIEHYQQETGRAGRDGLEAECVLLFSRADLRRWEFIMAQAVTDEQPAEVAEANREKLRHMERYCLSTECRHRQLSNYFGQPYEADKCDACDVCSQEGLPLEDVTEVAQAIIGCVKSLRERFGSEYTLDVLTGANKERIRSYRHNELPAFGSLRRTPRELLQDAVRQLISLGYLARSEGDRPVLQLTKTSKAVLEGKVQVKIRARQSLGAPVAKQRAADDGWEGVDRGLFERLRELRKGLADEAGLPAFAVFSDVTLRDLARVRPSSLDGLARVRGFGDRKRADFGEIFVNAVVGYCRANRLALDVPSAPPPASRAVAEAGNRARAYAMFDKGCSVAEVSEATARAKGTVLGYLEDYIAARKPSSIETWVPLETYRRIEAAAMASGGSLLRPVYEALAEKESYEDIRLVMRHAGLR